MKKHQIDPRIPHLSRLRCHMNDALRSRWLVDNKNDMCDAVRDTTLGLPLEIDYDALKEKALAGTVDWVPPAFTYRSGTSLRLFLACS